MCYRPGGGKGMCDFVVIFLIFLIFFLGLTDIATLWKT